MERMVFILVFLLLASCSSTSEMEEETGEYSGVSRELADIDNDSFVPPGEVPYVRRQDVFRGEYTSLDSLTNESIFRLSEDDLSEISDKDVPMARSTSFCYQKKFREGFAVLDSLYYRYKSHPSYWNQVGSCYLLQGNFKKAALYYNRAREIDPKYAPAINNLGVLYLKRGMKQQAFLAFKKATDYNPFALTPKFNLAHMSLQYGLVARAKRLFLVLKSQNPTDIDVLNGLAVCYMSEGKWDPAFKLYSAIDEDFFHLPYIGLNYSVLLRKLGKKEDALSVLEEVDVSRLKGLKKFYNEVSDFVRK